MCSTMRIMKLLTKDYFKVCSPHYESVLTYAYYESVLTHDNYSQPQNIKTVVRSLPEFCGSRFCQPEEENICLHKF